MALHGGAFTGRAELATATRQLELAGFRVTEVRYALHDVRAAYRAVAAEARRLRARHGAVIAYGESAGGTIASWLAARRHVASAVTVGAPQDLERWLANRPGLSHAIRLPTRPRQWRYSPARIYRRGRAAPLHAFHYSVDLWVPPEQTLAIERLGARARVIDGFGHTGPIYDTPHWLDLGGRQLLRRIATRLGKRCRA